MADDQGAPPAGEGARPQKRPRRIVSFSLYGDGEEYRLGAIANCDLVHEIYPGWTCRIFVSPAVPETLIDRLAKTGAEIVVKEQKTPDDGMLWRFLPAADEDLDAVIVRDIDSRLSMRERAAVDEWLASGKRLHIMRDHPGHRHLINGGMWGCRGRAVPDMADLIRDFSGTTGFDAYGADIGFLERHIYPRFRDDMHVHTSFDFFDGETPHAFPLERQGNEYVGYPPDRGRLSEQRMATFEKRKHRPLRKAKLPVRNPAVSNLPDLPPILVTEAVRAALKEDLGRAGDITSDATIPASARARAVIATRKPGVLAGLALADAAFREVDPAVRFNAKRHDGESLAPGDVVAVVRGPARAILSGERVALNFLCHLSGVATATRELVDKVAQTRARICDTRKTLPGLRAFEKYAVRCGGGANHRFGLDDAILIKDNHIAVAGGVVAAIEAARAFAGHLVKVEIEVDTLDQLREAMTAGPDVVLLDNMSPDQLREAVAIIDGRAIAEASGTVTAKNVAAIAEAGVDMISSGWITHSAPSLDLGLDITVE